jgi:hypothetical protein
MVFRDGDFIRIGLSFFICGISIVCFDVIYPWFEVFPLVKSCNKLEVDGEKGRRASKLHCYFSFKKASYESKSQNHHHGWLVRQCSGV